MTSCPWIPNPSVNVKWVETWKRDDVEVWVKRLQDMQLIEGKKAQQINIIIQIIKQRNITGTELAKCDTIQSIKQLFLGKINQKTGTVLFDSLNMERAMFQKKELSKMAIKKGKWIPRLGEKIRVVDIRYKLLRSYESKIMKIGSGYIIIQYGGYKMTNRVNRNEWDGRITILEDNAIKPQDNSVRGLPIGVGLKQVPNPPLIHPFRNKKVEEWDPDDVSDWVQSMEFHAQKYTERIKKDKRNFATAVTANRITGKELKKYSNGQKIKNDFEQYAITLTFCNEVYKQLRNVLNTEDPESDLSDMKVNDSQTARKAQEKLQNDIYNLLHEKFNALSQQHSGLKKENANKERDSRHLEQQNHKLFEIKDDLTAINASLKEQNIDQQNKYNLLLKKHNKSTNKNNELTKTNIDQQNKYHLLLEKYNKSTNEKNELTKTNCDLNEECKELKLELQNMKDKYNKWVTQNSDYTTWDYDIITDWIIGLDKEFIEYENELRQQLKKEEISGADLVHLDKNDLNRFGIRVFKHKRRIIQEIQTLAAKNNEVQNEGKKETVYIQQ